MSKIKERWIVCKNVNGVNRCATINLSHRGRGYEVTWDVGGEGWERDFAAYLDRQQFPEVVSFFFKTTTHTKKGDLLSTNSEYGFARFRKVIAARALAYLARTHFEQAMISTD